MYQINPRVFAADHSFKAIAEQLDQIQELGVNVLWFMPIYEIGRKNSVNSPYCIKDYTSVNPEFGTIDDFNALVKEAHKRGLSVILDWVANHTSWDCAWLEENPEWYTRDSLGNVIHPAGTGWKDVADLDFSNQDMRNAMIEDMKYWIIEHDVDGFRCDAADYVPFDFWKQAVTELRSIPDRRLLLLAEGQRKDHFDAGFDMNYAWGYLAAMRRVFRRNASVTTLIETDLREYEGVDPGKVKLRFTTNHDEAVRRSAVDEFGGERQAMSAFVATAFLRGGMLIYDSQEVGFRGGIDFFRYVHVDWASNPEYREEYKSLVKLYNEHPAIRRGHLVTYPHDDVLMFERILEDDCMFVAVNLRDREVSVCDMSGNTWYLNPYEYVIEDRSNN
ncbi:MAG: alpha-amylase [Bacteroidales bacterium]|nr:alpha-amylase [Bacteroidales bacterium]